ncbi:MAG: hypothetical protein AB1696_11985 [Planctomycetota bacterium]
MEIITYCGICGTRNVTQEGNAGATIHCTRCGVRIPVQSFGVNIPQIRLFCPSCHIKLCSSPDQGGDRLHCPKCHEWVRLAPVEQTSEDAEAAKKRKRWVWS